MSSYDEYDIGEEVDDVACDYQDRLNAMSGFCKLWDALLVKFRCVDMVTAGDDVEVQIFDDEAFVVGRSTATPRFAALVEAAGQALGVSRG